MIITCWHCGQDFEYTPPPLIAGRPREFYEGYTICPACLGCMGGPCMNPAHGVFVMNVRTP